MTHDDWKAAQRARRERRLRLLALAHAAGVTPSMGGIGRAAGLTTTTVVSAIDRRRKPRAGTVTKLASALRVSADALSALLEGSEP